jgi:hypothetical protein
MKSLLDPSFRYVSSLQTDLRKTFERVRKESEVQRQKPNSVVLLNRDKTRNGEGRNKGA